MRHTTLTPIAAILLLGACSGSGGTSLDTNPISAAGFADTNQSTEGEFEFTVTDAIRTIGSSTGEITQVSAAPITISGSTSDGPITLQFNGETYIIERDANDPRFADYTDDDIRISLAPPINDGNYAVAVSIFSVANRELDSGTFVVGFDTNPSAIPPLTGTATYTGTTFALLRNRFDLARGDGDLNLDVNFDSNTVSGTGTLEVDADGSDFLFDPVTFNFEPSQIDGNGFAGDISIASGDIGGTLIGATYNGGFFGPGAQEVGGQINGRIDVDNSDTDTFIDGAFLGAE